MSVVREKLNRFQDAIKRESAGSAFLVIAITLFLVVLGYKMDLFYSNILVGLLWLALVFWFYGHRLLSRFAKKWQLPLVASFAVIAGAILFHLFWTVPLPSREEVAVEFEHLATGSAWGEFHRRLTDLEGNPEYRDIWLINKGRYAFIDRTGEDPEQFLSLVQSDSPYYDDAQWLRLRNHSEYRGANNKYRQELLESMERTRYFAPVYFRLQLTNYQLSYGELSSLYEDFKKYNSHIFDFDKMNIQIVVRESVPSSTSLRDFWAMPGMVALFALRLAEQADKELLLEEKCEAVSEFDTVVANADTAQGFLDSSFSRLYIEPMVRDLVAELKTKPPRCD